MKRWKTEVLLGLCAAVMLGGYGVWQTADAAEETEAEIEIISEGGSGEAVETESAAADTSAAESADAENAKSDEEAAAADAESDEDTAASSDEDVTEIPERGISVTLKQSYIDEGVKLESYNYNMQNFPIQAIYYYYRPITDPLLDEAFRRAEEDPDSLTAEWQADFYEKLWAHSRCLLKLTLVPEEEYQTLLDEGKSLDDLSEINDAIRNNTVEFGRNDGYVYLLSLPDYDLTGLDEEEVSQYEECKEYMQEVKESLQFMPVELESEDTDLGEEMPQFTAQDLNGNEVTNDIFSEKDVTVVNVWGTFCTPCVEEMPELAEWAEEMPDNVQLIGLVTDIEDEEDTKHLELAKTIMEKSGAEFTQIIANDDFTDWLKGVVGVPTTFLVDSEGMIIGDPIVGADMDAYKNAVEDYLNGEE